MEKYIIIVSVYDQENTQSYPIGGVFNTRKEAEKFLKDAVVDVKKDHWTNGCVDGEDYYEEEFTFSGSFHAEDTSSGESLDVDIHALPVMSEEFPVIGVKREDIESKGFDASDLSDNDMQTIASQMADYILDDIGYWDALVFACERYNVKEKEEAA